MPPSLESHTAKLSQPKLSQTAITFLQTILKPPKDVAHIIRVVLEYKFKIYYENHNQSMVF